MKAVCCLLSSACYLLLTAVPGCSRPDEPTETITLATTTSTQDSGLLDALLPRFQEQTGIEVKVVAVGSGQAMELGRRGDADVLLTHAPAAEETFVAEGFGIERRPVMSNDFVLVGPQDDPAGIRASQRRAGGVSPRSNDEASARHSPAAHAPGSPDEERRGGRERVKRHDCRIKAALARIARSEAPFVSRGDESGTHMKEQELWKEAGLQPRGDWYIQAGAGMADALRIADQKRAYTLSDRGTFLAHRGRLDLVIVCEGDPPLANHYSVMLVNPRKHPHVRIEPARRFAEFLTAAETQRVIGRFGVDKYGHPLFFPNAE